VRRLASAVTFSDITQLPGKEPKHFQTKVEELPAATIELLIIDSV